LIEKRNPMHRAEGGMASTRVAKYTFNELYAVTAECGLTVCVECVVAYTVH